MPKLLGTEELKNILNFEYSKNTVLKNSKMYREFNVKAFNSISRINLQYGKRERRVCLYETLNGEKIYIQYPGKESVGKRQQMPYDFRPEIEMKDGTFISDAAFGDIWDILSEIGNEQKKELPFVASLFLKLGYMHNYKLYNEKYDFYDLDISSGDMEIRKEERKDWTRAGQNRGTSQDLKAVSEALSYLRQKGLSTVEDLEAFLEASGKSAADYRNQMKPKEARSKVIDGILAGRTDCKECKPVYEKYQKIFFKKTKEKFKQEHPEVARYEKAAAYLAKHPDDKDKTKNELQQEQETLLSEIAELKVPLTEVQEDLKKLRDIRYWVRKATPGTEESKEPPKKQPIKEVLQDKADEKKAQRTAPAQAKHRQQDMEL